MVLRVLPIQVEDFPTIISHATLYSPGEDLIGAPTTYCWPVTTKAEAYARLDFHFAKQKSRFLGDSTTRYMKVVEETEGSNEIVSIARWHFFATGYEYDTYGHWETHSFKEGQLRPENFNVELHNQILTTRDQERKNWIPKGKPCWMLMHMVTRPSCRGKGAAGMLVRWGVEQANSSGASAYLEAGVLGRPVYEKYGFKQVGDPVELSPKSLDPPFSMPMCKMVYTPAIS